MNAAGLRAIFLAERPMLLRLLTARLGSREEAEEAGVGDIEQVLRRASKSYVLGVKGDNRFGSRGDKPVVASTAAQIANDLDPAAWQCLSAGQGTKGERLHDWTYFDLADLEADEGATGTWTKGLFIRRPTAHRASSRYRLVMPAMHPSSRRSMVTCPIKTATVMLSRVARVDRQRCPSPGAIAPPGS